jgi:hypothetical protein
MTRLQSALLSTVILVVAAGCSFERGGTSALPTSPAGGGGSQVSSPLKGRWSSSGAAGLSALQDARTADLGSLSCTQIAWTANDQQDDGSVQGPFTAVCSNGMQLSGFATGSLTGSSAVVTGSGTGQLNGSACQFTITSNGVVEGEQIRFPYSANTCLGTYAGTTFLARSALPVPPPPSSGACAGNDGDSIVECVATQHPGRLAAGVSHDTRVANMAFLRDRIIERGRCKGLDLAWNLKRGVGPHSIDALLWRVNGRDEVVDIGVGYDDTSRTLELQWLVVAGPPGYDRYTPAFGCN